MSSLDYSLDYRSLIAMHNDQIAKETGTHPTFFVQTYGCQMNSRDSEKLTALIQQLGYKPAESQENADFILYNTCCVRESAESKIFGHLSRLKRLKTEKPNLIIGVCGCMSQQPEVAQQFMDKHKYVNLVFGTVNPHRLPEFLWETLTTGKQIVDITTDGALPEITGIPVTTREYPHKAGVNIMYGCDNYCSFCIVPYVRGREKSRPANDILDEVKLLVDDGVKEIMLLGQNVNSYNSDGEDFAGLLRRVNEIDGLERMRFMTSHPKDFSDEMIVAVRDLSKICKSVHLPLQSGSTPILLNMNRKYTQQDYLTLVEKLYLAIPDVAISTDIIVGYPGETEEDFQETLKVVRMARFSTTFTFMFSPRSGTPAAKLSIIPSEIVSDRFNRLIEVLNPILLERNNSKIGKKLNVMVEDTTDDSIKGRTDDHTLVHFTTDSPVIPGDIIPVLIKSAKTFYVMGATTPRDINKLI